MRPDRFLADCTKFDAELDQEIRIEKFAAAELDEEEQNPERLRRWFRDLRRRDVPVAASQQEAERRLKEREERLGQFVERVYACRGGHENEGLAGSGDGAPAPRRCGGCRAHPAPPAARGRK